jgi:hypothetical protein
MNNNSIRDFIISVRVRSRANQNLNGPSKKSVIRLIIQMEKALSNKKLRIPVLQAITGLAIIHSYSLTQGQISVLIDETIDNKGDYALALIEKDVQMGFAEDPIGFHPADLYPWEAPMYPVEENV